MISDIDKDWTRKLYRKALVSLSKVDPPWLALTELKKYSFHSRSRGTLQNLWGSAEVFDILILLIIKTSQKPPSPINLAGYLAAPLPSSKSEVAHRPTWSTSVSIPIDSHRLKIVWEPSGNFKTINCELCMLSVEAHYRNTLQNIYRMRAVFMTHYCNHLFVSSLWYQKSNICSVARCSYDLICILWFLHFVVTYDNTIRQHHTPPCKLNVPTEKK